VQEAGGTVVADIEVVAAGDVGQSTGEERLAHAGWAKDKDVEVLADPLALGQLENEPSVQTSRGREVEILVARGDRMDTGEKARTIEQSGTPCSMSMVYLRAGG